jgi:hypothetical protein
MNIITQLQECSKEERIQAWNLLNNHPDTKPLFDSQVNNLIQIALEKANLVSKDEVKEIVKDELDTSFDNRLITSDLEVLPRIRATEKVTGIYQFEEWEEHEPTIPEQIKELTERHPCEKSTDIKLPVVPETTLEHKACAIVEHLKEKIKPRNDAIFMNSNEIINFLKCELPEDLRLKEDIRNPRQAKKDILEKAIKLFSNSVQIIRNKSGNKVTGIALKPSVWRPDTYGC